MSTINLYTRRLSSKLLGICTLCLCRSLFHCPLRTISLSPFPPFHRVTYYISL
ncbi:hypothetical protein HMPREF9148_02425 [Prevotella sp. F0091]|nr:hypothetical protein HMPREF9148_02425 [Prevotella sp. F0091]